MTRAQHILIVEDDVELRRMYRTVLRLGGFLVREAGDGYDALTEIEQHPPDLVILDLMLPRISGVSVREEIAAHALTRNIPIVVVTGSDAPSDFDVACLLRKPVTPDRLLAVVCKCLAASGPGVRA